MQPFILRFKIAFWHFSSNFSLNILFCKGCLHFILEWTTLIGKCCRPVDIEVEFNLKEVTSYFYEIISSKNWGRNQGDNRLERNFGFTFHLVMQVYTITPWLTSRICRYKRMIWLNWKTIPLCFWKSWQSATQKSPKLLYILNACHLLVWQGRLEGRKERNTISKRRYTIFFLLKKQIVKKKKSKLQEHF